MERNRHKDATGGTAQSVPVPARLLGAAGLIPFIALTGILVLEGGSASAIVRQTLIAYSIAILAFMGAVHWGLAMGGAQSAGNLWRRYSVSVLPALAASATVFVPADFQFWWLGVCFFALLFYDLYAVHRDEAPPWYPRLRWPLTIIVCVCLFASAL